MHYQNGLERVLGKTDMSKRTVLITGSSRGLGKSLAMEFASNNYNIILHGRDRENLSKTRQLIEEKGVRCYAVEGDIAEESTIADLAECAEKNCLDVLINNAGMYLQKSLEDMEPDELRRVIDVNLIAPVLLTKKLFNVFKKKGSGLIMNINSFAGKGFGSGEGAYCASKHGLKGFMGCFKFESLKHKVSVMDIYLGALHTDMTSGRKDREKFMRTEEVAKSVYLLSENYSSIRINEVDILRKIY